MDLTRTLPYEKLDDKVSHSDNDFDVMYTPPDNGHDEENERYPTYTSGEVFKFQLGMIFNKKIHGE